MEDKYESLKIENQLCFPLYAAAKEIVGKYHDVLSELNLTYTQYIVMMVLWHSESINVKELGDRVYLDSGTLTPLLKKLESKGYIKRVRDKKDERNVYVSLTKEGIELKDKAVNVPPTIGKCIPLSMEEAKTLYNLLYKVLENL